ncbi:phosphate ABC transporter permease PstA [soil metagenome]
MSNANVPSIDPLAPTSAGASLHSRWMRTKSRIMFGVCVGYTVIILVLLALVIGYLVSIGFSSISKAFFTLDPIPSGMAGAPGGMRNALIGTGVLIFLASLVGIPMGMLTGVYLAEYEVGSWFATPVRFVCDVLAGVPSIVVGILGYELVVRPLGNYNGWAGAMALAFIMVPIVARTTEEMLRLVPSSYREASIALGATKAVTILKVVIPSSTASIVTGVMLAIARVAGETAPLLFTALGSDYSPLTFGGSFPYIHASIGQPFPSLTVQIFSYATHPNVKEQELAWAGILVLIGLIFVLNVCIRFATRTRRA